MYYKQAFCPGAKHHHGRRDHHMHHPFKQFIREMKSMQDTPPANVEELDDRYILSLYVPGLTREDIEIKIKDETLVVASNVRNEEPEERNRFRRKEFGLKPFERYFQLNEKIDKEAINAKYEDGILTINLPKLAGFESYRQNIEVQ